jgi:hypothetical protein
MLQIRQQQLERLTASSQEQFRRQLADVVSRYYPAFADGSKVAVECEIARLIERARSLGFSGNRDGAAFVMAALAIGEQRLIATAGFAAAAFDVTAGSALRADRLMDAIDEVVVSSASAQGGNLVR